MLRKPIDRWVVLGDIVALIVFAAIGRQSHNEANPIEAVIATAMPFIIGWLLVAWPSGLLVTQPLPRWVFRTIVFNLAGCGLGLLIRSIWLQRDIPMSFAVVSFLATASLLVIVRLAQYRRITKEIVA
ncbi:MAG: hypothetical protein RI985_1064 [Chloroflexota bacterium]|jgi:hypothetical protein